MTLARMREMTPGVINTEITAAEINPINASITDRDYPILSGVLVFYSVFLVILNFLVDVAYGYLDPRIRDRR